MSSVKMKEQTACFAGHTEIRYSKKETEEKTYQTIIHLTSSGYRYFGVGGTRGYDAMAAKTVIALKPLFPQIRLIIVLPFPDQYKQERGWKKQEIEEHYSLLAAADKVVYISQECSGGMYFRKIKRLVDASSVCVVYLTEANSDISQMANYARSKGVEVVNLAE